MTLRPIILALLASLALLGSLFLASCDNDLASREELFLPELKLGTAKQTLEQQLHTKYGYSGNWDTIRMQQWPTLLGLGYRATDSTLMSINYQYLNTSGIIDDTAVMLFNAISNKSVDKLGTPDDWIRRDSVSGQRLIWYFADDSSVVSLEQKRTGDLLLELTRSGQRYRDVMTEMGHFLEGR